MTNRTHPRRLVKPFWILIAAIALTGGVAHAQPPRSVPNGVKYRDAGIKPATGRSGSATLAARALMGIDGQTTIEATTGSFEAATAPGTIAKVQMKAGGQAVNFNNLASGGFWAHTMSGLSRGQQVQLQANITGIDPKRTGVVTVTTGAARRPDLTVTQLSGAPTTAPNAPVAFIATLSELNGDVGARADCVLSVDGQAVQQSDDIWIDAGGTVSCLFETSFASPGTYTVAASAQDVRPGDWNTANNAATTTIVVRADGGTIPNGYLQATQINRQARYCYSYGNYCDDYRDDQSSLYFSGWESGPARDLRTLTQVDVAVGSNAVTHFTASLTPTESWAYDDGSYAQTCQWYSNVSEVWNGNGYSYYSDGNWFQACSYSDEYSSSRSYYYQHIRGQALYHYNNYYYQTSTTYNYTYGAEADYGWSAGDTVRLNLAFVNTDGTRNTLDRSVTLEDRSQDVNYSHDYGYNWYSSTGSLFQGWINWWQ